MLDRLLGRAGIDRARFRVANVLCCRPPRNYLAGAPYEHAAIGTCAPLLDEEIRLTRPKVIVALGNIPLRRLAKVSGIGRYRGYPILHESGAWIVPTYHPSHLLPRKGQVETAKLTGMVILDLKRAVDIAEHGYERETTARYRLDPSPSEAAIFAVEYENAVDQKRTSYLSVDIETPGKLKASEDEDLDEEIGSTQILRMSFCFTPGYAMSVQWSPEYLPVIRRILSYPGAAHVVWNGYAFDVPILEANGMRIKNPVFDGMWGWHLLQSDLPRGLEAVTSVYAAELGAWKHLGSSEPARYNAMDADAALRCMLGIERDLKERGQWDLFQDHIVNLHPILFRAGRRNGVRIDRERQDALRAELLQRRDQLLIQAQGMVGPLNKAEKLYIRPPKGKTPLVEVAATRTVSVCDVCGARNANTVHFQRKCPTGMKKLVEEPCTKFKWEPEWSTLSGETLLEAVGEAGFNPVSSPQLIRYAKDQGHPIGENYKTGSEQLDKKVKAALIKRFGATHPIYALSQELSELTKTLGTYVDGYTPDSHGLIYTTYSFAPSTGRLSSRNVNLQNVSRGSNNRHARAIRETIVPRPGHVFVEADSSAIEAVMSGFFMDDAEYIRLARTGIHDYVTCVEMGLEFDPAALKGYRKDPRYAENRERNKRVVHGTNYGMSPKMMVMQYPEVFRTERDASYAQATYFKACPRLAPWQHEIRTLAHKQTFLKNPWGYRHYFYQVFEKNDKGEIVPGPDAKRCVAFLPQSSAAAFMRDSLVLLGSSEWMPYAPAIVSIHDSIALDVPIDLADHAIEWLIQTLTRPIPLLNGLRIGCEVKQGRSWAEMEVVARENV